MKVKNFVEVFDFFQGIKLIDANSKKLVASDHLDKFKTAELYGDWYVYIAYTAVGGEDLIIEITTEEF